MGKVVVVLLAAVVVAGMVCLLYLGMDLGSVREEPAAARVPAAPEAAVREEDESPVARIAPEEVKRWLEEGRKFAFIDVRTPQEFEKWRIPQGVLTPIEPRGTFVERARRLISGKDAPVVLFCRSGRRSEDGARLLMREGYSRAYNMGGIIDWEFATEGHDM